MAFALPNPTVPTNGQSLDATPVLQNILALAQAIQAFDGSQIVAGSIVAAAMNASINPNTLLNETTYPFVFTGLVWSIVSGLTGTMTGGTMYYNGIRVPVNSIASNAFTASKDTYVDIDVNGNVTYQAVTNNVASPSITANSIRVAIIITSGAAITSINQGSTSATGPIVSSVVLTHQDALGNIIYPTDPTRKLLGYRQVATDQPTVSTTVVQVPALSCPVITPTGRKVKVSSFTYFLKQSTSGAQVNFSIWDGPVVSGTQLQQGSWFAPANNLGTPSLIDIVPPTSGGAKTYNTGLNVSSNTGTLSATSTSPAYIKVEL